jgi:hypothetical protein
VIANTSGSTGVYEPYDYEAPVPGAKKVRFGADFVFCNKSWSVEAYSEAAKVCEGYGDPARLALDVGRRRSQPLSPVDRGNGRCRRREECRLTFRPCITVRSPKRQPGNFKGARTQQPMTRKLTFALIPGLIEQGLSKAEIAARYDVTPATLQVLCCKRGISLRRGGPRMKLSLGLSDAALCALRSRKG